MYQEAQTVLNLLLKRGFEAFYIGGKTRNELHNQYHSDKKIQIKDIDIITNATPEEIVSIFPKSELRGESFQVVVVKFGGLEFEVATYRKDIYDKNSLKESKKIVRPTTVVAKTLDQDRDRRDYTINAIAQDINDNYIDYTYKYRNKKISAIEDIQEGIIRAIGNARQRFEEDPLRILRAFRFKAQLGYEIESQTLKAIEKNLSLIEKIPHERISGEMNKLILGKFAASSLCQMKEIGFFNIKILNSLLGEQAKFLPGLNDLDSDYFDILTLLNRGDDSITEIEAWTMLLLPLGVQKAKENLETIYPMSALDIEKVEWLIEHNSLIDAEDLKIAIYNARTGIVKRHTLMCMRDLIQRLGKIHVKLRGKDYKLKSDILMKTFCSRPYFAEQLRVKGEDLIEMAGGEEPGPWIKCAKEKLILKLINVSKFPILDAKYRELAEEAVEEAIAEKIMKQEGLL